MVIHQQIKLLLFLFFLLFVDAFVAVHHDADDKTVVLTNATNGGWWRTRTRWRRVWNGADAGGGGGFEIGMPRPNCCCCCCTLLVEQFGKKNIFLFETSWCCALVMMGYDVVFRVPTLRCCFIVAVRVALMLLPVCAVVSGLGSACVYWWTTVRTSLHANVVTATYSSHQSIERRYFLVEAALDAIVARIKAKAKQVAENLKKDRQSSVVGCNRAR